MATKNTGDTKSSSSDSPTTDQAAESIQQLLDRIAEQAADAEARIRKAATEAQSDLRERSDNARDHARALSSEIESYVHEHPLQALGIAFVGGMFLSSFLKRR